MNKSNNNKKEIPNTDTIKAMEEIQKLKKDPTKKVYASFTDLMKDIDNK